MRLACIDVGSNTTRLLVADATPTGIRDVRNERVFTLIGRSLAADRCIPEKKIEETAAAVAAQAARARADGADRIRAVATAAIRGAANAAELRDAVQGAADVELDVLAGEEEARLAFRGAAWAVGGEGTLAVVDVGGMSTEIAFGDASGRIAHAESIEIGSAVIAERHFETDPPGTEQIDAAQAAVATALADFSPRPAERAVAVGGSASSLQAFAGASLDQRQLGSALELLRRESAWDIASRFELDPERVRLLPAGLLILTEVARRLGQSLRICKGGLREGVILEMSGNAV